MKPFDNRKELINIFRKYLNGTATPEEKRFVEAWYQSFDKEPEVLDRYSETEQLALESRMEDILRQHTEADAADVSLKRFSRFAVLSRVAAAAILIFSLGGAYHYFTAKEALPSKNEAVRQDLAPGKDRAVLTLSDGSQIALDQASTGILARQGNTLIQKLEDGLVSYTREGTIASEGFNTVTAPSGGKYSVLLPDGSRVWLNAESSITFPTAFAENERAVKIAGEAYFEIARDSRRPFSVQVGNVQKVRVLGTHFNINSYRDEATVTTTLLEGSVEITPSAGNAGRIRLKPGEQAALSETGKILVLEDINTEEVVAWKNGIFQFEKADIKTVMRQFCRWYNVDVVYEGTIPDKKFSGKIDRHVNASEALDILRFTGLNFRIEALPSGTKKGKIIVLP